MSQTTASIATLRHLTATELGRACGFKDVSLPVAWERGEPQFSFEYESVREGSFTYHVGGNPKLPLLVRGVVSRVDEESLWLPNFVMASSKGVGDNVWILFMRLINPLTGKVEEEFVNQNHPYMETIRRLRLGAEHFKF